MMWLTLPCMLHSEIRGTGQPAYELISHLEVHMRIGTTHHRRTWHCSGVFSLESGATKFTFGQWVGKLEEASNNATGRQ
jgi:hypothetical protein